MHLEVTALNSGSNGNCYYVGNEKEAILVDVGISCREVERRLKRLELSISRIKAIFVSHEHSDHIRGIRVLSKKYHLPVYITPRTLANARLNPESPNFIPLRSFQKVVVGSLEIFPFHKLHDAADPHSFVVHSAGINVGIFTDIGYTCENVIHHFKQCHAVFLEANYDAGMLERGYYPYYLKNRIRGGKGHLSNDEAYQLFLEHRPPHMSHVFLSHLSKDNNDPDIVLSLFRQNPNGTEIIVASRDQEIPVYKIGLQ